MPSRRTLLRSGSALPLVAIAGCLDRRYADGTSSPSEWPTARHDARNTGCVPEAAPPTDPGTAWERSFDASDSPASLVAGGDDVFVARSFGTSVLDEATGETRWRTDEVGDGDGDGAGGGDGARTGHTPADGVTRVAGLLDGTLYTADGSTIRAYDVGDDGDEERHQWSVDHPASGGGDPRRSYGLLPTPDGVFWATHGRLDAFGPDGGHQWGFTSPGSGAVFPAVAEGRLYVAVPGALLAASRPGVLADVLDQGPSTAWRSETHSRATWPMVAGDRVIVGDRDFPNTPGSNSVQAIRPDGSREWGHDVQGATSHLVLSEATGRVVFVTVDEETGEGAVTALDVASGDPAWTRTDLALTGQVGAIALAGDTVLVTGFVRTAEKPVRALAIEDGETRWTRSVRGHPTAMAAAGGRVFVGTALGNVVAFE